MSALSCLVAAGLLWGTGGVFGTLLGQQAGLGAVPVAAYRLLVGGALIVGWLVLTRRPLRLSRAGWSRVGQLGALAALFQGCYFGAVALTSVSLATLVTIGSSPVLVLALGRRRASGTMLAALPLAMAGLALLVGSPGSFPLVRVLGSVGLALAAAAGFATVTLLGARPVAGLDDLTAVGLAFTLGGALLTPLGGAGLAFDPSVRSVALLLALGLGPTAAAYTCYFRGLRTVPAPVAAVLALLEPLVAALLAAVLLGDRLGPVGLAGAVLLAAAMLLASRTPAQRPILAEAVG